MHEAPKVEEEHHEREQENRDINTSSQQKLKIHFKEEMSENGQHD